MVGQTARLRPDSGPMRKKLSLTWFKLIPAAKSLCRVSAVIGDRRQRVPARAAAFVGKHDEAEGLIEVMRQLFALTPMPLCDAL